MIRTSAATYQKADGKGLGRYVCTLKSWQLYVQNIPCFDEENHRLKECHLPRYSYEESQLITKPA